MISFNPNYEIESTTDYHQFYYQERAFSLDEINWLDNFVTNNYQFEKGRTGVREFDTDTDAYKHNNRNIAYIQPRDEVKWLYEKLGLYALAANDLYYNFDIDIVTDPIHYVIYPTPTTPQNNDGGHLDWHMDIGSMGVNRRKLAMTVQLSDYDDYEGGDFQIWGGGEDGFMTLPRKKGDVIVFPAFLMHRVTPITKGERRCLVFWSGGRPLR